MIESVTDPGQAEQAERFVLARLGGREPAAELVADLVLDGRRSAGLSTDEIVTALDALRARGRILVVPHAVADPHLADAVLDVAALVGLEADPSLRAAQRAADAVWSQWIGEFLASHRCGE